jgi:Na+-transporting methylmalonyl-CoA/oxaloacetate decarboxylase gamma subunit
MHQDACEHLAVGLVLVVVGSGVFVVLQFVVCVMHANGTTAFEPTCVAPTW